jgi:hypothetical protein
MAAVRGNQVKSILKRKGFNTRSIRVTTERSFIKVNVSDWSISLKNIEDALKDLNTVENISNDLDPIYIGDTVVISYESKSIPKWMLEEVTKEIEKRPEFDINNFASVERLALDLLENDKLKHLGRYNLKELIKESIKEA